ncbi:hypothetical protein ACI7RC_10765 [Brevibacillus sp. B_LB10_24]|uniref:hypothetical protein n=1 Tax=Brevibacillus sp. B_LB10_24 TaxID=3380645 RepID=UPI0038B96B40
MSISSECRKGDNIFVIEAFVTELVLQENSIIDEEKTKEYHVGKKLTYLDRSYGKGDNKDILIKFQDENGCVSSAVETYFVTENVWRGLLEYFNIYHSKR